MLETSTNFLIRYRKVMFEYISFDIFDRVEPDAGPLEGGYPFSPFGDFKMILDSRLPWALYLGDVLLNPYLTQWNQD